MRFNNTAQAREYAEDIGTGVKTPRSLRANLRVAARRVPVVGAREYYGNLQGFNITSLVIAPKGDTEGAVTARARVGLRKLHYALCVNDSRRRGQG
eukprot:7217705-Pyramimonas_sp.AAC.1